jgi:glycosyltransferase involved in cell wall biosynthesis
MDCKQPDGSVAIALLTGGGDKDYAVCLASALAARGVHIDFIGSDDTDCPELHGMPLLRNLNLRGSQRRDVSLLRKALRLLRYYMRLITYAAKAKPEVFHILWNNKFQLFDRTLLMLYYKTLGKRIALTAHNINSGKRDGNDSFLNRFSLKCQYKLSDRIFVHTEMMKSELTSAFSISGGKVSVVPYGLYNNLPQTAVTSLQAKRAIGLDAQHKSILFFGNIAPYKGLHYLIDALRRVLIRDSRYRLIIAGAVKNCAGYWSQIQQAIAQSATRDFIIENLGFIPDAQVEVYFKSADVLVLPYTHIFQSGVLFLGYSFGLPVIATDVGSLREEVVEGRTGFVCGAGDSSALASAIESYFASNIYRDLASSRQQIKEYAERGHSWAKVGEMTRRAYSEMLGK